MRTNSMRLPTRSPVRWATAPARIASVLTLVILLCQPQVSLADMVLSTPDGRKVELNDNGTWRYQDSADAGSKSDGPTYQGPQADLQLLRMIKRGTNCRLTFSFTNNLPYEVRHIVPYFSVSRANGVVHDTISAAFQSVRPSDKIERFADFSRITCADIARVQVTGGDRCEMDNLTKFTPEKGQCLARVKVVPSDLVQFDK
jgi:hypothetical protein